MLSRSKRDITPSGCMATSKIATDMECITGINCLMKNLRQHDTDKLRNYLRMELPVFEELFSKAEPVLLCLSPQNSGRPKSCVHKVIK